MKKTKFLLIIIISSFALFSIQGCGIFGWDITGTWNLVWGTEQWDATLQFQGDKKSGNVNWTDVDGTFAGTYTVDGDFVNIDVDFGNLTMPDGTVVSASIKLTGAKDSKNLMSGTYTLTVVGYNPSSGTWTATR